MFLQAYIRKELCVIYGKDNIKSITLNCVAIY